MTLKKLSLITISLFTIYMTFCACNNQDNSPKFDDPNMLSYEINLQKDDIHFFLKDEHGHLFSSLGNLKTWLEKNGKQLIFAMNGGMFSPTFEPVGLYIENGKILSKIDTQETGYGNFYLQPNGIFYITTKNKAIICKTTDFVASENIKYATQSGSMLLIEGKIHPKFNATSNNVNIRNAVGILPNGNLLFAMSKNKTTFYDVADFFLKKGCINALYLDGFVSKTYLPSQNWMEEDGNFGVIIAQIK